ncbi:MAG: cytochrome c oxidase assembly protein [Rhodospirillaceae bacterium]|nr:cytochrome c oxidase assembly protein [Rhodospirillaceae bacterium]
MTRPLAAAAALLLPAGEALAGPPGAAGHVPGWDGEPWVPAGLAVAALGYAGGLLRLRVRGAAGRVVAPGQVGAFAAGLLVLALALLSPLDAMADQLFSAHMTQHLLLMMAAAPLLVWARPATVILWAFGARSRRRVGRAWRASGLHRAVRAPLSPLVAWTLFSGVFLFWHIPGPYGWALRSETVHAAEHLSFLVSALAFWTIVIEPSGRRRLAHAATLVFIVATAVLSALPGALMLLAPRPLYAVHAQGAAAWGLSPLEDQQLAGLIMWVPAGLVYVAAAAVVFLRWLKAGEAQALRNAVLVLLAMGAAAGLAACDQGHAGARAAARVAGDPSRGAALIRRFGCGSCHIIPGLAAARGLVGPPLIAFSRRVYLAGVLPNTPDNLVAWLRDPQRIVPGNVMPAMGIDEGQAGDIAAYLYTIR